jgi:hypothetical protein
MRGMNRCEDPLQIKPITKCPLKLICTDNVDKQMQYLVMHEYENLKKKEEIQ